MNEKHYFIVNFRQTTQKINWPVSLHRKEKKMLTKK